MAWVGGAISAGGSILGGMMGGSGADKAAKAQAKATKAAIAESARQYDISRADMAPWRDTGSAAINRLGVLLGLTPRAGTSAASIGAMPTREQFTTQGSSTLTANDIAAFNAAQAINPSGISIDEYARQIGATTGGGFDQSGYDAAMADWNARKAAYDAQGPDAGYGDLLKKFTVGDFWADPVTQLGFEFGLGEGTKGLTRMAAARGGLNSGATLKALTRYGTDYTGTKAAESRGRFVDDQTNLYNRFAGVAGSGQTAANTSVAAGQNYAGTVGNLITSLGNARGAAAIAKSNAYGGALGNAANTIGNYFGSNASFNPSSSYNAAGQFTPYYTGYGAAGDYQYG